MPNACPRLLLGTRGHTWVIELPEPSLLGRGKLAVLFLGVVSLLILNMSELVDLRLRGRPFMWASGSPRLAPPRPLPELVDTADTHEVGVELF